MPSDDLILPVEIQDRLLTNGPLHQQLTAGSAPFRLDFFPIVKLSIPCTGIARLLTEADRADRDLAFGLHIDGSGHRLAHVRFSEIVAMRGPTGSSVRWHPDFISTKTLTA